LRADTSIALYRMELTRPDWRRTLRFRTYDDRKGDRVRVELLEPRKAAGTVFLKLGSRLWMDLTQLRRRVAISPAMMQDAWMGSDFSNQDLLEAATLIDEYDHQVVGREQGPGGAVVTIRSVPSSGAAALWGSLVQRIRADGVPLEVEYRDADERTRRRLSFHEVRPIGGRTLPTRWVMEPLDRPGSRTELVLESVELDVPVPEGLFGAGSGEGERP
jgi:hypothetical protein